MQNLLTFYVDNTKITIGPFKLFDITLSVLDQNLNKEDYSSLWIEYYLRAVEKAASKKYNMELYAELEFDISNIKFILSNDNEDFYKKSIVYSDYCKLTDIDKIEFKKILEEN